MIENIQEKRVYTFADWIKAHPVLNALKTNKEENLLRIIQWGLYTLPHLFLDSRSIDERKILEFCEEWTQKNYSIRALPKHNSTKRGTFLDLQNVDELLSAIDIFLETGEEFIFLIAAYSTRDYVGNIIVSELDHVIVEVVQSDSHPDVSQGMIKTVLDYRNNVPYSIEPGQKVLFVSSVSFTGQILHHPSTPQAVRKIVNKALHYIKMQRGIYLRGYYEFVHSSEDGLSFIDAIFDHAYIKDWMM